MYKRKEIAQPSIPVNLNSLKQHGIPEAWECSGIIPRTYCCKCVMGPAFDPAPTAGVGNQPIAHASLIQHGHGHGT